MLNQCEYGIVVYGATGYTGRLVCEYLNEKYGVNGEIRWAMAGRSLQKLETVRDELGISVNVPLVVVDAGDQASIDTMVASTDVVLTTVGPYLLYGSSLVKACAETGTDYVDLCGEPSWMYSMINAHGDAAKSSGARIVFSCGFDSIPFDLGVFQLQRQAMAVIGEPLPRVKGRVRGMKGTMSGGTLYAFRATEDAVAKDPSLGDILINPFALTEGFSKGPKQPSGMTPMFEADLDSWLAPFVMSTINTKNIHRSNFLQGHNYGEDFVYDEMLLTGAGEAGETAALEIADDLLMGNAPLEPGEGPSKEERDTGCYDILFIGSNESGDVMKVSVKGDKDPGYGSTSKMIAESAVCLLQNPDAASGGIWTPASAMGELLIERLQKNAGLSFQVEN